MTETTSTETSVETETTDDTGTRTKRQSKPLTPSAAAARKRPVQDRRPKAPAKSQQAAQAPVARRAPIDMGVERDAVDIGFDFRAIPVRLGPGGEHLWYFNPDPDVDAWAAVQSAVAGWENREPGDIDMGEAAELVEGVRAAVAGLLYNDDDREAFLAERRYGPMALARLAARLMEEVTGFPTEP